MYEHIALMTDYLIIQLHVLIHPSTLLPLLSQIQNGLITCGCCAASWAGQAAGNMRACSACSVYSSLAGPGRPCGVSGRVCICVCVRVGVCVCACVCVQGGEGGDVCGLCGCMCMCAIHVSVRQCAWTPTPAHLRCLHACKMYACVSYTCVDESKSKHTHARTHT